MYPRKVLVTALSALRRRVVAAAAGLAAAALAVAPPARAAGVQVYVQAPFDLVSQRFDLSELAAQGDTPVFSQSLTVPYPALVDEGRAQLAALTQQPFSGHQSCDWPCPDADWTVTFDVGFDVTVPGQPVLTPWGAATSNGTHVALDAQVAVDLTAHVHVHTSIQDADADAQVHALIGAHGQIDLTFYPVLSGQNLDTHLTWDGGNVEITGLDGQAIGVGSVLGAGIGWMVGADAIAGSLIGAIVGEASIDAAREEAEKIIQQKAKDAIDSSGALLTQKLNALLQPQIANVNDLLAAIRTAPIPGIGGTLGDLEAKSGMSIDVRSVTQNDTLTTAITTRFANPPGAGQVSGLVRFPKTACHYVEFSSLLIGHGMVADQIVPANQELDGQLCSGIDVSGLRHNGYFGESPEYVLQSGDPGNDLPSWAPIGNLSMSGIASGNDTYDCAYSLDTMPDAAIFEIGADRGSPLYSKLADRWYVGAGRYLMASVGGVPLVVDSHGALLSATGPDLGGPGPATLADCPMVIYQSGTGLNADFGVRLRDALNSQQCPQCTMNQSPWDRNVSVLGNAEAFISNVYQSVAPVAAAPVTVPVALPVTAPAALAPAPVQQSWVLQQPIVPSLRPALKQIMVR